MWILSKIPISKKIGWDEEKNDEQNSPGEQRRESSFNKKDIRKLRSDIITRRSKEIKPLEDRVAETENSISEKESLLEAKNREIIEASGSGKSREIETLSKDIHSLQREIDQLILEYETLTTTLDERKEFYESELKKLEE